MPVHNQLFRQIFNEALKRAIGDTKGEGALERYGETLTPAINLWDRPEWSYLRQERLWARHFTQGAVVGENSVISLRSPSTAGLLIVVEAIGISPGGGAMSVALEVASETAIATATLADQGSPLYARDTRVRSLFPPPGAPAGAIFEGGSFVGTVLGQRIDLNVSGGTTNSVSFIPLPIVLSPGNGVVLIGQAVNLSMAACFVWRERKAFPGELTI